MTQAEAIRKHALDSLLTIEASRCNGDDNYDDGSTAFICEYVVLHADNPTVRQMWEEFVKASPDLLAPKNWETVEHGSD